MPCRPLLLVFLTLHGCLSGAAVYAAPPPAANSPLVLEVRGGRLTVQLDRVPLRLVLSALARQAGIRSEFFGPAGDAVVSAAFADLPLEQGIAKLLSGHSYMVGYGGVVPIPGAPRHRPVVKLWVIPGAVGAVSARAERGRVRQSATDRQVAAEGRAGGAAAAQDPDPQGRLKALEQWNRSRQVTLGDGPSIDPVTHALVDPDERVRARAQELFEKALTN